MRDGIRELGEQGGVVRITVTDPKWLAHLEQAPPPATLPVVKI